MPAMKARGRGREVNWNLLYHQWATRFWTAEHCFLENVHSMPQEGVSSAFKFGLVIGGLRGIIASLGLPLTLVTPNVWKKYYGIQASKSGAVRRATELFPDNASEFVGPRGGLKDGPAEAALIARYGYDQLMREA
jgi:crossover junction endodeoxyribonuclease RuvC